MTKTAAELYEEREKRLRDAMLSERVAASSCQGESVSSLNRKTSGQ